MAAEKAILCVLFEEFSEPNEIGINTFINTHVAADCHFLTNPPNNRKEEEDVVQPGNRSKTLGTGVSLNVPLVSVAAWFTLIGCIVRMCESWLDV